MQPHITLLGVSIPIVIEPEADGEIAPVQREAARLALSLPPDILDLMRPVIWTNYDAHRDQYGGGMGPAFAHPNDLWKQVQPLEAVVPPHQGALVPTFFLRTKCNWSYEEVVVRFRDGVPDQASRAQFG